MFPALRSPRTAFGPSRRPGDATTRKTDAKLFLFAEQGGDGFLFLLEDTSDIGGDVILERSSQEPL
jgi:hypothetical protein